MLVGIDGNEANVTQRVGVNVYAFELLRHIAELQKKGQIDHSLIVYLKDTPLPDLPKATRNFQYRVIPGRDLWILTRLMPSLFLDRPWPNIFFSPSHYVPPFAPTTRVCAIMDLGYLNFQGQFKKFTFWQLKYWSAISIFVSKAIIAISNSTKEDIVRHYPFASKKTYVTHLAYDTEKFNPDLPKEDVRRIKEKYTIVGDYILFLGTLKPSKNIERLIAAFASISNFQFPISNVKLVVAGKKGWMYESIFEKVRSLKLEDRVIFTDFVAEEDKPGLISGAKVFVLPSFWEGFGLDVLNAMACGLPVVCSKVGSLTEVAGDAAIYVDPESVGGIAEGIAKVLSMGKLEYNKVVEKGLAQVKKFSWEKTAKETLKILEETV